MVVELFGLPGAGKSTLARALADGTDVQHVRTSGKWRGIVFLLRHPRIACYWFFQILHEAYLSRTWGLMRFKCALFASTCAAFAAAERMPGTAVIDEGFIQRMLSIFETKKDINDMTRALQFIPMTDVRICVVGNETRHFARYRAPHNMRAQRGDAYLAEWEAVLRHNYESLCCALGVWAMGYYTYDPAAATVEGVYAYIHSHE